MDDYLELMKRTLLNLHYVSNDENNIQEPLEMIDFSGAYWRKT